MIKTFTVLPGRLATLLVALLVTPIAACVSSAPTARPAVLRTVEQVVVAPAQMDDFDRTLSLYADRIVRDEVYAQIRDGGVFAAVDTSATADLTSRASEGFLRFDDDARTIRCGDARIQPLGRVADAIVFVRIQTGTFTADSIEEEIEGIVPDVRVSLLAASLSPEEVVADTLTPDASGSVDLNSTSRCPILLRATGEAPGSADDGPRPPEDVFREAAARTSQNFMGRWRAVLAQDDE